MDHTLTTPANVDMTQTNPNVQKSWLNLRVICSNFDFSEKNQEKKSKINDDNANTYVRAGQIDFLKVLSVSFFKTADKKCSLNSLFVSRNTHKTSLKIVTRF